MRQAPRRSYIRRLIVSNASASAPAPTAGVGLLLPAEVHFDDLDAMGLLHNSRYQVLVERAWIAFWYARGFGGTNGLENDAFNVVKAFTITYEAPLSAPGAYAVHLWIDRLGSTSATAAYRVCSSDGGTTYAHGTRTAVRLDRTTFLPTPWSDRARGVASEIMAPHEERAARQ
ncbi:acyl-CoA thioesterase [Streptomyces sp. NPDC057838]|uniref:acyl-CoA thioesterase n=1 Tax=unclassified Streptomyces TaxID=2593676 RepID=UPI0036AB920B